MTPQEIGAFKEWMFLDIGESILGIDTSQEKLRVLKEIVEK